MSEQSNVAGIRRSSAGDKSERFGQFFAYHGIWAPGVRLFRQIGFTAKALIITIAFALPLLAVFTWQMLGHYERTYQARLETIRQHVEIAHGIAAAIHKEELSGRLTRQNAQADALRTLSLIRYGENDAFWVSTLEPKVLIHPASPNLNGQKSSDIRDPNEASIFTESASTVRRAGKGFVTTHWSNPGVDDPVDKVSYVAGFEPWDWMIGTGIGVDDLNQAKQHEILLTTGIISLALLFSGYLFVCFYRVMDGGLRETRRHLRAMSNGDLTTTPSPWGRDEAAGLMHELRDMQNSLRGTVFSVRHSSEQIVNSSIEIASGAKDLSTRTEQAADSLEQSAASMEKISTTVSRTADNIREASSVAQLNAQSAKDGGAVMKEVVKTMEGIHSSSAEINDIIGTIDGITFQTNLLALNAAVEAARAGDQGRGFAIVANEVRALAQRSATAALEVRTLISGSVVQIEAGTQIVRKAAVTIKDILTSSQRVDALLGEVATAAQEQTAGVSNVGSAVQDLDRMTQQNAAMVQETSAGADAMKNQAQALAKSVAHFKTPANELETETEIEIYAPEFSVSN